MSWMNSRLTQGGVPCNITIDPSGEFVLTANYMGGSITVFPLDKEGALGEVSHVIPINQVTERATGRRCSMSRNG